jgi:cytochrome c550
MKRCVSALFVFCTSVVLAAASTQVALAIPVFANGQGISCEVCHTTFPGMTPYGMMVMMTNFQTLDRKKQDQALPFAVRAYVTSQFANSAYAGSTMVSDVSLLGAGFLGKNFTWYLEQHIIDSGFVGSTEQMWLSWNGLLHGTNSLQIGKFHTPFPFMPAHAWTLGSYLLATQTTGQNTFNPNDARWGIAFNGMSNEFMYNVSYLTNSGTTGNALDYNGTDNPRTLDFNVSYGGMSRPWSVGVVGMRGYAAFDGPGGAFAGTDAFTREGVYYGYQTSAWHFQTMFYHGFDAQPSPTEFDVPLNGFFAEIERDIGWRNHLLFRYDVASSDTFNRQYVFDVSHNFQPNVALIGEVLMTPHQAPSIGVQVAFAGPYVPGKRFLFDEPQGIHVAPATPAQAQAPAAAPSGSATDGEMLVSAHGCMGCHGANFQGGIGPALFGIEHRLTARQISSAIEHPKAPMPNFGFSAGQVADIVAYLSSLDGGVAGTGATILIEPANPATDATISVRFPGAVPAAVRAQAVMQMGPGSSMTTVIDLKPTSDPHVLGGRVHFFMSGPWVIRVQYGTTVLEKPIEVGAST